MFEMDDADKERRRINLEELREFKKFLRGAILTLVVAFIGQAGIGGLVLIRMGELLRQVDINTTNLLKQEIQIDRINSEQDRRTEVINEARELIRKKRK